MGAKKWKLKTDKHALTINERDFIKLYLFGGSGVRNNASECYRRVYLADKSRKPSNESIWHYAWEIMKKPHIKDTIHEYQKTLLDKDWVLNGLAEDALDSTAKHADRIRAKELIGKTLGMFVDKTEVNIKTDAIFEEET